MVTSDIDKMRFDTVCKECNKTIEKAKENYLQQVGLDLADPQVGQKIYWKIVNIIMNKCKPPKVPPILVGNKFIINCKEKATVFAKCFAQQCQPLINDITLVL